MKRHIQFAMASLLMLLALSLNLEAQPARGGSAFMFYDNNDGCSGVVKNYDDATAKSIIQSNLSTMYSNGQRKLTVWLGHYRGASSDCNTPGHMGIWMDSDYQNFEMQYMTNLENYLTDAGSIGFNQVVFIMAPGPNNFPRDWPNYTWGINNYYDWENKLTIMYVRQAAVNAGMPFIISLLDEAFVPAAYSQPVTAYVHDCWKWYIDTYGLGGLSEANFTIGGVNFYNTALFNSPASQIDKLLIEIGNVGYGRPTFYMVNMFAFESNTTTRYNMTLWGYMEVDYKLNLWGEYTEPIVVTSTFENDTYSGHALAAAAASTGRPISFLMQWPLTTAAGFNTWDYLVQSYNNYISWGF